MPAAYPEEFRRRAVDLVRESDESVSAVARRLGISSSGLWNSPGLGKGPNVSGLWVFSARWFFIQEQWLGCVGWA